MNKTKRAIIIFPQFGSDINLIQDIRNQYDPLTNKIAPHITLVFPFESEISSNELRQHVRNSLYEFKSFNLTMQRIMLLRSQSKITFDIRYLVDFFC